MASAEIPHEDDTVPGGEPAVGAASADTESGARSAASAPEWRPGQLILLAGPTGSGKTALSLELAEALMAHGHPAEILNADAMQLYRGMDVGTAKLPPAERRGIPHHLFDVLGVTDTSTVHDYQQLAREKIVAVQSRGSTPILVGGSGLYISAVIRDFQFPGTDDGIRARLEAELETLGGEALWQRLRGKDARAAESIDPGNGRRIVRALEVIELTGEPYSASLPEEAPFWKPTVQFFLDGDREELKRRLRLRAEQMWAEGLVDEVRGLIPQGFREASTALRAIGYAQALAVLDGAMTGQAGLDETDQLTARYARRQRSWFARYAEMHRIDYLAEDRLDQLLRILGLAAAG